MARIDHPNIVRFEEAYEDEFKIYFVMEEFKGGTLFDRIIEKG
jgi:serine/threonine protein kinase